MVKEYLVKNVNDIWEGSKYETRADTLRVRLMRQAKKIPLFLLHNLHSKSKYKSNNIEHVREAYLNTYKRFLELLEAHNLDAYKYWDAFDNLNKNPPDFIKYWTLHFPESKVELLFGREAVGKLLLYKKSTSLKGFLKLGQMNRVLFQTLKLLKQGTNGQMNEKAMKIIDDFLKYESEFFSNSI